MWVDHLVHAHIGESHAAQDDNDEDVPTVPKATKGGIEKLRSTVFGSRLSLAKVRCSDVVEIVWYMRRPLGVTWSVC